MKHRTALKCRLAVIRLAIISIAFVLVAQVQAQQSGTLLLRNVTLIKPEGDEDKVVVNILIKDSKLDVITEDLIPLKDADESYDAAEGVVLGELKLGQVANFIILAGDPRKNVELLLDTKTHARFVIYRGAVMKNTYATIFAETPEEKERAARGWLAYSPPPLAVPLNYRDESRWNRFDGKYVSGIVIGAVVLDRQRWTNQDDASRSQVGDLSEYDGGEIRGLRFGAAGTLNFDTPWIWTIAGATHAFDQGFDTDTSDDITLFDLRLDIPIWENVSFSVGKQKEPISMERIMSLVDSPMQERAAVSDTILPSRNTGVVLAGNLFDSRVTLAGGLFNDWLDKDQPSSPGDNSTQFVGRATWLPYVSENGSTLLHLGAGLRYSNFKEAGSLKSTPEFNQSPEFLETDVLQSDDAYTYQAEASLRTGPFWLHGEYIRAELEDALYNDPTMSGYHLTASWLLSGEVRPYNRRVGIFGGVPISRSVNQNGWGAWELATRFSHLDLSEVPDVNGGMSGEMDIWSAGINWWASPYMNINFNYRYITLDRYGVEGSSQGVVTRVVLLLE
jgi:phosphate-selective porin OprO/OprP